MEDVARGTVAALKPLGFETINLGSDRPVVINRVISLIEESLGKKARIETGPRHPTDPHATWADISRAKRILGWEPQFTFEEGLNRTVRWYQENRDWVRDLE